jgi:site-specific recombinase XerD
VSEKRLKNLQDFVTLKITDMNSQMHLTFQLKTAKVDEQGKAPIYSRITINGRRTEFSVKRRVEPSKWINKAGVVKGSTEEARSINTHIATIRSKLFHHYNRLLETGKHVTPETVKNSYFGIIEKSKTLVEVFEYHNEQVKTLIDKEFSFGTYERYCTALNHCKEFLKYKYNISDIPVKQINHEFITELEYYLKAVKNCSHNTAIKYITNFKKIMRICLGNGWIEKNPFINYKIQLREVEREFLSEDELQAIADKEFTITRLNQVRDVFLFCCFTGLAYADVKKLCKDHLLIGIDGERWIKINRTKTDTRSTIPLLPTAQRILDKYAQQPKCIAEKRLLPVLSNQKMNNYLKEIADACGITKNITFHLARHSFATTVTLTNDVPIESVSKMLGHKSLRTTQHYAKIIDKKVSNDMQELKKKLNVVSNKSSIKIA